MPFRKRKSWERELAAANPIAPSTDSLEKNSGKGRVLVVGRGYANILNMVRALGSVGYEVDVLRVFKKASSMKRPLVGMSPEASSKYVSQYVQCVTPDEESAVAAILKLADQERRTLLVPVDDFVALAIDAHRSRLSQYFIFPGIQGSDCNLKGLMRKDLQKRMAEEEGMDVLPGKLVDIQAWSAGEQLDISFPCFVKPNVSADSSKEKIARCENEQDLQRVLSLYASANEREALVEEYVEMAQEYSILGVSAGGEAVSPGVVRALEMGKGSRCGVMLTGQLLSEDALGNLVEKCNRMVAKTGFSGIFDVDLLKSQDGTIYFSELNFHPGASTFAVVNAGANLPAMFADAMLNGMSLSAVEYSCNSNVVFVNEKLLLEECVYGELTVGRKNRLAKESDVSSMKSNDDPAPYEVFRRYDRLAGVMRLRAKLKHRN